MKASILSATVLSCSVFSCLTFPLVALGSKSVQIEFQKESIFYGSLKDIASPYLGVAAAASLGVGAIGLSVCEWRKTSRKQAQAQATLSQLQQELKQTESHLEELKLSDSQLLAKGYYAFLEPETAPAGYVIEETAPAPEVRMVPAALQVETVRPGASTAPLPQPAIVPQPVAKPIAQAIVSQMYHAQMPLTMAEAVPQQSVTPTAVPAAPTPVAQSVITPLHSAPMPVRLAEAVRPTPQPVAASAPLPTPPAPIHSSEAEGDRPESLADWQGISANLSTVAVLAQVSQLQSQLQQMTAHVATLQDSLLTPVETAPAPTSDSSTLVIEQLHRRLQRLESDWTKTQAVS